MWTKEFWKQTIERAVKTFAQTVLALISAGSIGITDVDWLNVLNVGGLAALISLLTSVVSGLVVNESSTATPSLVKLRTRPE